VPADREAPVRDDELVDRCPALDDLDVHWNHGAEMMVSVIDIVAPSLGFSI
jgi:hypothetical protein